MLQLAEKLAQSAQISLGPRTDLRAFGVSTNLRTTDETFLTEDSLWRLQAIYEPYLASHLLPREGVMLDIGAGFGSMAVPFATAMQGWTVWAFEPNPEAFAALEQNIAENGLDNVIAVNAAVRGGLDGADTATALLTSQNMRELEALPTTLFRQAKDKAGFLEAVLDDDAPNTDMVDRRYASIPAAALKALGPTALKIVAPAAEQGILDDLGESLAHVFGEMWHPVRSRSVIGPQSHKTQVHLPLAGTPLILRQGQALPSEQAPGLDVVVALYNNADYIADCVGPLLESGRDDVNVLVVDDGSTDDSAEVVRKEFGDHPRLKLLQKANGGCASARNHGRRNSTASHVAFVDSDDVIEADFFPKLLELARYSGSEVVQGSFETLETGLDGQLVRLPTYERDTLAHHERIPFGDNSYFVVPSHQLIVGQPAIWRRIYRRDFLDSRNIWFPEHIRAFDDQIFQLLTLHLARDVYCRDDCAYLYRQHPNQDIRAGDERWFHSLEMFRLLAKRAVNEGWNDIASVMQSFVNTVNWVHGGLRDDLKAPFLKGAGELWVYYEMALGRAAFGNVTEDHVAAWDFRYYAEQTRQKLAGLPPNYAWVNLDSVILHPAMLRAK